MASTLDSPDVIRHSVSADRPVEHSGDDGNLANWIAQHYIDWANAPGQRTAAKAGGAVGIPEVVQGQTKLSQFMDIKPIFTDHA